MLRIKSWLKRLCVLCLILLMQGPAMLVQEGAWAKMLVSYTGEKGFARGVVATFDGRHPCEMCVKAAELRENEGRNGLQNHSQEKKPVRITWGEMIVAKLLVVPMNAGSDCLTSILIEPARNSDREQDSPVLPPPKRV